MIDESIAVIDQEEKADDKKHAWCAKEQSDSNSDSDDKEDDIATLQGNIGDLDTSISDTKDLLAQAENAVRFGVALGSRGLKTDLVRGDEAPSLPPPNLSLGTGSARKGQ